MTNSAPLAEYARTELRGEGIYRGYKPKSVLLQEVASALPRAHVVVVSGSWCPDCRREVPKLARILEELPSGWTVEIRNDSDEAASYDVQAIPSFIVLDRPGGTELGRITESPRSSAGLEGDLVAIARGARAETNR